MIENSRNEKKRTILVTGASGGIGMCTAVRFAEAGHRVVFHANTRPEAAAAAVQALANRHLSAMAVQADLRQETEIDRMFNEIRSRYGRVEVLVNNAGAALPQMLLTDCAAPDWDALFAVNVRGMFLCSRAALPDMIQHKYGSIVNISSMWGVTGGACEVAYSASKAAVIGLTKALAKEVAPSGVRVNCVAPGFITTDMNRALPAEAVEQIRQDTPLNTLGTPEDVASAVSFLALGEARFITGQVLCVDGGICV